MEVSLKELKKDKIHKDSIVWLTSFAETFKNAATCVSCKDKEGTPI
jgi:hypothetical protein